MVNYASFTDAGCRTINEDTVSICDSKRGKLFILADGLGGHGQGEVASRIAAEAAKEVFYSSKTPDGDILEDCMRKAQGALIAEQSRQNKREELKTTLTLLLLTNDTGHMAHIGDSRIYRFCGGEVDFRTKDHSVPQMLALSGEIEEKDIRFHEDRNRLLRVLGMELDNPKFEISAPFQFAAPVSFLLCSDGFWEWIEEDEMLRLLKRNERPEKWLSEMAKWIRAAGKGHNMDNYSAIAVFVR